MKRLWSASNCSASQRGTLIGMVDTTEDPPVGPGADKRAAENVPRHVAARRLKPTDEATPGVIVLPIETQAEQEDEANRDEKRHTEHERFDCRHQEDHEVGPRSADIWHQCWPGGANGELVLSEFHVFHGPSAADAKEGGDGLVLRDHDCADDHDSHARKRVPAEEQQAPHEDHSRGDKAADYVGGNPVDDLREQASVASSSRNLCERRCSHSRQCNGQRHAVANWPAHEAQLLCDDGHRSWSPSGFGDSHASRSQTSSGRALQDCCCCGISVTDVWSAAATGSSSARRPCIVAMTRMAYPMPRVGEPVLYFENSARRRAAASIDLQAVNASPRVRPSRSRLPLLICIRPRSTECPAAIRWAAAMTTPSPCSTCRVVLS